MAKFKVGDRVRVRKDLKSVKAAASFYCNWNWFPDKLNCAGMVAEVVACRDGSDGVLYSLEKEGSGIDRWSWTPEMLETVPKFAPGDRVRIINTRLYSGLIVGDVGTIEKSDLHEWCNVRIDGKTNHSSNPCWGLPENSDQWELIDEKNPLQMEIDGYKKLRNEVEEMSDDCCKKESVCCESKTEDVVAPVTALERKACAKAREEVIQKEVECKQNEYARKMESFIGAETRARRFRKDANALRALLGVSDKEMKELF